MQEITNGLIANKFLNVCNSGGNASIYSLLPFVDYESLSELHPKTISNALECIHSAISVLTSSKSGKQSPYYKTLKQQHTQLITDTAHIQELAKEKKTQISKNPVHASLAYLSSLYAQAFFQPLQCFLPHSSVCCGRWEFWNDIDYLGLQQAQQDKNFHIELRKKIMASNIWNYKPSAKDFPTLLQRQIRKEEKKSLNPEAMIKAIIIRLGEMTRPYANYEVIDFTIRTYFRDLGINTYLRVDREIMFCRGFEQEMENIIKKNL